MKFTLTRVVLAGWVIAALAAGGLCHVAAAEPGPAAAEFDRVFGEWQTVLGELRELKEEYKTARGDRKSEIESSYDEIVDRAEAMQAELIGAAQDAFREAPGAANEVKEFLINIAVWMREMDDYENALPLAESLVGQQGVPPEMAEVAGASAAALCKLDLAEKYLRQAAKDKVLSERGSQAASLLEYYREAWPKEQAIRQAEQEADDLPRVELETSKGTMVIELFENEAPNAVANFVSLVEKGFYDGLTFHRVLPGFMAQGGCPDGTGGGGPGYSIPCECYAENHRLHFRGTLSMAHAGRDTGGSQFFLTFVPTQHLDGKHTAFGRVIDGFDVLGKIQRRNPEAPGQPAPDKILKAKVLRKRDHAYEPEKVGSDAPAAETSE